MRKQSLVDFVGGILNMQSPPQRLQDRDVKLLKKGLKGLKVR